MDIIAEWHDAPDLSNPLGQVFGLMPPETQEAMKAHGGPYERYLHGSWTDKIYDQWAADFAYRVKPAPIRETVTCWWSKHWGVTMGGQSHRDTHLIQFDLIDSKPDLSSIRMEVLK